MRAALAACLVLVAGPVLAAGGISCTAEDEFAKLELQGGVTHGMGGPLFSFEASVAIQDKAVAEDLRQASFGKPEVAQYWFDNEDLMLVLYREREGQKFGSVEVIMKTKPVGDDITYVGTYAISVFEAEGGDPKAIEGKIECQVE